MKGKLNKMFLISLVLALFVVCLLFSCKQENENIACEHRWVEKTTVQSTCLQEGSITYVCSLCNEEKTETTEMQDHDYQNGHCIICQQLKPSENLMYHTRYGMEGLVVTSLGECTDLDIVIPSFHQQLPVVAIDWGAFDRSDITSVVIPDTVKEIGGRAFEFCTSLQSVTMGEGVQEIGNYCFYGCTSLESINLTSGLKKIGENAFSDCTLLKNLTMSCSAEFGRMAFWNCVSLEKVNFVGSLHALMENDFGDFSAEACPMFYARDIYLNGNLVTEVVVPESITEIKNQAFSFCMSITKVVLHDNISKFRTAFVNCPLEYEEYQGVKYIGSENNKYIYALGVVDSGLVTYNIHPDCVFVGVSAFRNCPNLESILIPPKVKSIGQSAFYDCANLSSVEFATDTQLNTLGEWAFYSCVSLTEIVIPDSVMNFGNKLFYMCSDDLKVWFDGMSEQLRVRANGVDFGGITEIMCVDRVFFINGIA